MLIGPPCIGTKDRSCVAVCPVDCIIETEHMLVIDPTECIGCSVCEAECPVEANRVLDELPAEWSAFAAINAAIGRGAEAVDVLLAAHLA